MPGPVFQPVPAARGISYPLCRSVWHGHTQQAGDNRGDQAAEGGYGSQTIMVIKLSTMMKAILSSAESTSTIWSKTKQS